MQPNLYEPPKAELIDQQNSPGSALKAVLLGLAVDIGGSIVLSFLLGIVYALRLIRAGVDPSKVEKTLTNMPSPLWLTIVGLVLGGALSVLGGFTCARIARRDDYKLGFILGGISSCYGLYFSYPTFSLLISASLAVLTFGCILLGTKLGQSKS